MPVVKRGSIVNLTFSVSMDVLIDDDTSDAEKFSRCRGVVRALLRAGHKAVCNPFRAADDPGCIAVVLRGFQCEGKSWAENWTKTRDKPGVKTREPCGVYVVPQLDCGQCGQRMQDWKVSIEAAPSDCEPGRCAYYFMCCHKECSRYAWKLRVVAKPDWADIVTKSEPEVFSGPPEETG